MENLNLIVDKYIELRVIKNVNDDNEVLELINNIRNKIDGLSPNELNYVYDEYKKKHNDVSEAIIKNETSMSKYHQNKENKSILLSAFFCSISMEINKLKYVKKIYQEILLYIKQIKRKRRRDSILRLTKKYNQITRKI